MPSERRIRSRTGALNIPAIADYALIGDLATAALVSRAGSLDWLCWPRFDSPACFASVLGTAENGMWTLQLEVPAQVTRRYRGDTLVLETLFETEAGAVALIDFMPIGEASVVRIAEGRRGTVYMRMAWRPRCDYGAASPLILPRHDGAVAFAGPDRLTLTAGAPLTLTEWGAEARFPLGAGARVAFTMQYDAGQAPLRDSPAPLAALAATEAAWRDWSCRSAYAGLHVAAVRRSLLTLKALTHAATGSMVAAPTTSLPEQPGGSRNWDYRYCWLRDSALAVLALLDAGQTSEALAWRDWLLRAVAGDVTELRIMYGLAGERRLAEWEAEHLSGHGGARPVRIGNGAAGQLQLDVVGEVMTAFAAMRACGLPPDTVQWDLCCRLVAQVAARWREPDEGIWEVRGGRRHFTTSKAMVWVALDRAIAIAEATGRPAPLDAWRALRGEIHDTVCREGFNVTRGAFTQSFGSPELDASVLLLPLMGFLPAGDPRIRATTGAIERELLRDGLVLRYETGSGADGLPAGEGVFLPCSFWLVDVWARQGRMGEAHALFTRLLGLANDVGLLAEEYDPATGAQLGNFPQAFTHAALVRAAFTLARTEKAGGIAPAGP